MLQRSALALALLGLAARPGAGQDAAAAPEAPQAGAGKVVAGQRPEVSEPPFAFCAADLRSLPRPSDVWSVVRNIPGVLLDRANVGGSDSALQSAIVSHGDNGSGAAFTLDGVDLSDPASLGFLSIFPDLDAVERMEVRTLAADVRVRSPGAQVALFTRAPQPGTHAALRLRGSDDAFQADNLPGSLQDRPFLRNRTQRLLEMSAEAQGWLAGGKVWLWGTASRNQMVQQTFTEHQETLRTTNVSLKTRFGLLGGTVSLLGLGSEKTHEDRDTGFSSSPESRWRQSGPVWLLSGQDQRRLGRLWLLTRLSYLDAGFRLEPQGGSEASIYEDLQGILRGSYYTLDTKRPRLQAGLEASAQARFLGLDHDLLLGAGYRRSQVTTRQTWPGNGVYALERQSVFFRTFHLTGFALPQRDAEARSLQEQLDGYLQDTVRAGRFALTAGLRLDRLQGRNLASSVEANPVFPADLPAVIYAGDPSRYRWLDLLPRLGLLWDITGKGRSLVRAGYAAYGASLGVSDVSFDNPLAQSASVSYYWRDNNGNHVVEPGELDLVRGKLGASGVDPEHPAAAVSPHRIDPAYRAPRTHEATLSFEQALGGVTTTLRGSWRRLLHPRWTPLRNLTLADYAIRGAATGQLFDQTYSVGYYSPASESKIVPGNGRLLANREGYRQEAFSLELVARGRVGRRFEGTAWGSLGEWLEFFDDWSRASQDPTSLDSDPLQNAGTVAVRPGGLGRSDVFVSSRWTAGACLRAELPWRLAVASRVHARDGFPIPYYQVVGGDPTVGSKNLLVSPALDTYRLPSLVLVDLRLERGFRLGRGSLVTALDVFNLLNRGTTLQVTRDVELPALDRPREILRPRIARLGLEWRF